MRRKHLKQAEVRTLPNVFHSKQEEIPAKIKEYFNNNYLFTLELGCGNGEHTIDLALQNPTRNFIGVDRAGARIWNAAKAAEKAGVSNAAFFLTYVERLREVITTPCVEEILIPFPNPLPRRRHMKAMLVHPRYLAIYKSILIPGGKIHLKTDDDILYQYACDVAAEGGYKVHHSYEDVYKAENVPATIRLQTRFEKFHLSQGKTIKYICFSLT